MGNEENCKLECSKNEKCEGFTGLWNEWCVGCRQRRFLGRCNCNNCNECDGALGFRKIEAFDIDNRTITLAGFEELMLNQRLPLAQLELVVFKLYKQFEENNL